MMKKAEDFLSEHRLRSSDIDMEDLVRVFLEDMASGLEGRVGALRMIPTYIEAENDFLTDTPVLAIDAGGTNFRAAIVTVSKSGNVIISDTVSYRMPGLDGEISSNEFFRTVADYIRPLAENIDRIGFCFSYPTEILPDKDGRLLQFCKEVQAPEVHGQLIGKRLLETLGTPHKKIVLLNDTVATLLAGKSASAGRKYDSFIGFILGTGTNTCYIEQNRNIRKMSDLRSDGSQIINIESGDFGRPPRTGPDIEFCNTTTDPGSYKFEKMFSGAYFGGLTLYVLKAAAKEGVFSNETAEALCKIADLHTEDANSYVARQISQGHIIVEAIRDCNDADSCRHIIEVLIDRAAKLVAGSMSAVILKCGKGRTPDKPVLITVEGTTFYKLHDFRPRFELYLNDYLTGEKKRYFELTEVDQSGLTGAALAALTE
jgi:hexokinase